MTSSKTPPACQAPVISSSSPVTLQVRYVVASSKTPWVTADAQAIPSTKSGFFCTPRATSSPHVNKNDSERPSRQMRRISVSKSPTFTGQVREVFHQDTPAQGRRLAAHLIQRLPTCPIPEIARLGRTLRKWKDALDAYFDTSGASNGPTEAINGHYRTRKTHRQRLPQPHQLPTPNAPHHRKPRRLHPHSTLKSPFFGQRVPVHDRMVLLHGERHQGAVHDRHGASASRPPAADRPAGTRGAGVRVGRTPPSSPHPTARLRAARHRDDDRGDGAIARITKVSTKRCRRERHSETAPQPVESDSPHPTSTPHPASDKLKSVTEPTKQ